MTYIFQIASNNLNDMNGYHLTLFIY